jgi:hypothetical protein
MGWVRLGKLLPNDHDEFGSTLLARAIHLPNAQEAEKIGLVNELLIELNAKTDKPPYLGQEGAYPTHLFLAARDPDYWNLLEVMLDHGARKDIRNELDKTVSEMVRMYGEEVAKEKGPAAADMYVNFADLIDMHVPSKSHDQRDSASNKIVEQAHDHTSSLPSKERKKDPPIPE